MQRGGEETGNQIECGLRSLDELWGHPDQGGLCNGVGHVHGGALRRGAQVELDSRAAFFWLGDLGGWTILRSEPRALLLTCKNALER